MPHTLPTPGPWAISRNATPDYAPQFAIYSESEGGNIAPAVNGEANANAIALLPELVDAIGDIISSSDANCGDSLANAISAARELIAKLS